MFKCIYLHIVSSVVVVKISKVFLKTYLNFTVFSYTKIFSFSNMTTKLKIQTILRSTTRQETTSPITTQRCLPNGHPLKTI